MMVINPADLYRCWNSSYLWRITLDTLEARIDLAQTARFVAPPTKEELLKDVDGVRDLLAQNSDCVKEEFYREQQLLLEDVRKHVRAGDLPAARRTMKGASSFT